jgi:hypothetical protein
MNTLGLISALATFLGVWLGHVLVRSIEYRALSIKLPAAVFALLGLALELGALLTPGRHLSAFLGILGITAMWDALEFVRQQKRVMKGHAPANPANPRHVRYLAECPFATTLDVLKR